MQVAFASAQGFGQQRQFLGRGVGLRLLYPALDKHRAAREHLGSGRQHQHGQGAAHLLEQAWQGLQVLTGPTRLQAIAHQVLGLLQHVQRLSQHDQANLGDIGARQAWLSPFFERPDHAVERGFHVQQGPRHIHQHRVIHGPIALGQPLQRHHLIDDDPTRLLETQHGQGIGHVAQGREQHLQLFIVLPVAAHKLVQAVLDAHEVVTQCRHYRP